MPKLFAASGIFHPETGGPATYLKALLPALQDCGWDVRLLSYGDGGPTDYPHPVVRIPRRAYPLRRLRYGLASRENLAWADLVYVHSIDLPLWGASNPARVMKVVGDQAWERCIRRGWVDRRLSIDDFQNFAGDWRVRWQKAARSRQVGAMRAVIVPSHYLKRMVVGWGVAAAKVHVIYNAVPPLDAPAAGRAQIRAELGWDARPTLLAVARLQPWKGVDYLLGALADLPPVRLVVAGDGPDLPRLQKLAAPLAERVQFVGRQPQSALFRLMRAADGLAVYSSYEGLSHTLLESLRLGTPVLASDCGGNPELVRDGVNGVLVPYGDRVALRRGIQRLLAQRAVYAAQSQRGLERFRFEAMVSQTDALLKSLL